MTLAPGVFISSWKILFAALFLLQLIRAVPATPLAPPRRVPDPGAWETRSNSSHTSGRVSGTGDQSRMTWPWRGRQPYLFCGCNHSSLSHRFLVKSHTFHRANWSTNQLE